MKSSKIQDELNYSHFIKQAFSDEIYFEQNNIKIVYRSPHLDNNQREMQSLADKISHRDFIGYIHSEYTKYYLEWMLAYMKLCIVGNESIYDSSLRLFFPFKDNFGYFTWSMLKVSPHRQNEFIVLTKEIIYLSKRYQVNFLPGEIWVNDSIDWTLTNSIHQKYRDQKGLKFTKNQKLIIELNYKNPDLTHLDLANMLGKSKNTIDVQCKQIVKKASEHYGIKFKNTRAFINYLKESYQKI